MNTAHERLYDVVIFEKTSRKIESVIGKEMRSWYGTGSGRNTAELRVQTGFERINGYYSCQMVPSGKYKIGEVLER